MTPKRKGFRYTPKGKASTVMSRFIRFRDALDYCREHGIYMEQFTRPEDVIGQCCTCGAVKSWIRMDAGHWQGRGMGGGSGVYFDERNVDLQCKPCNGFEGGRSKEHEAYLLKKYSQEVIDELELKHRIPRDNGVLAMQAMEIYYKGRYNELLEIFKGDEK